ncbi:MULTISPECIES: beta-galactosidase trimerization domain-containing protein [unclassified Streptomyces]|uniref:beta-galactosidase trimerization domain-containing protein n=1 Tax=unclassified Streptomyces TaxID=2593676 RepID=UPI000AEE28E8|nr:beta-galactosidase trimerization domain-containing protein [Streptomyces sp. CB02058]
MADRELSRAAGPGATGTRFTLSDGVLHRDGQPFFSVGFNYHPSETGCQYWQEWDEDRLDADFGAMAAYGFNTVRFFVFWADFEPEEGVYDEELTRRIQDLAAVAHRHGLQILPSLLTIWMNGQRFEPAWREGRDLWTRPEMAERARAFVHHIAGALRDAPNVLAYDLGDEVIHVDPAASSALSRTAVQDWWRLLATAVREADPAALVLQANEASAVVGDHGFRPENAEPLDLVGLHGFPVWSPFHMESVSAWKAGTFLPYLVRHGRASTPVLVDEMGSYGCDEATAAAYLRVTAHSAFAAGACGVVVWCWQDFTTERKPYALRPGERFTGLLRADGRAKPAMAEFRGFADRVTGDLLGFRPPPAPVGIYLPPAQDDGDAGYLTSAGSDAPASYYAHLLLQRAHLPHEFTHGDLDRYRVVVCPSVRHLSRDAQRRLEEYAERGGVLLYTCADFLHGFGGEHLLGVRIRDFTLRTEDLDSFVWEGERYPLDRGTGQLPVVELAGAKTLAEFPDGSPAVTRHSLGAGTVHYCNAPLEAQLNAPHRLTEAPWHTLYEAVAREAGVRAELTADHPDVEVAVVHRGAERRGLVINHSPLPVRTTVTRPPDAADRHGFTERVDLEGKGVHIVHWTADPSGTDGEATR